MICNAVIGANFGDEGKGLLTDYFTTPNSVVVRYCGGANAGHTVQLKDGTRHVFHHFGSGTLRNATTLLSRNFISNPILYLVEKRMVNHLSLKPAVFADFRGMVTTPFDMMINQMSEEVLRSGSCGVGINETVKRHENKEYSLSVGILHDRLADLLVKIRNEWVPKRLAQLNLTPNADWKRRLASDGIIDKFIDVVSQFDVNVWEDTSYLKANPDQSVIFEGSQGLLLDKDHEFFPYVTNTNTGLKNVIELVKETKALQFDVTYVTRAYATRHGAGPFPHEEPNLFYADATNVPNEWQGSLRFGYLDLDLLAKSISLDRCHLRKLIDDDVAIAVRVGIAVTCLDQMNNTITYITNGRKMTSSTEGFLKAIYKRTGVKVRFVSYGSTKEDVRNVA